MSRTLDFLSSHPQTYKKCFEFEAANSFNSASFSGVEEYNDCRSIRLFIDYISLFYMSLLLRPENY